MLFLEITKTQIERAGINADEAFRQRENDRHGGLARRALVATRGM